MFKWPIISLCGILNFVALIALKDHSQIAFFAILALGVIMLIASWSVEHLIVYVSLVLIGIVIEILSVQQGLWSYSSKDIYGIPFWVPLLWSNFALFIIELKEVIDDYLRGRA